MIGGAAERHGAVEAGHAEPVGDAGSERLDEYVGIPEGHPQSYHEIIRKTVTEPMGLDPARVHVPDGFATKRVELSGGLTGKLALDGRLLTVDYTASSGADVEWKVFF